jgi:hypothetical protein
MIRFFFEKGLQKIFLFEKVVLYLLYLKTLKQNKMIKILSTVEVTDNGQLIIIDSTAKFFTGPTFKWLPAKNGIVESWNGSHGEETRLVVKCDETTGDSALDSAIKEFGSQTGDYAELYKKVKAFLKKSV